MLRVALTGGVACGKSVVSRMFRAKGCAVDNADETARALMSPGRSAWKKVVARFGRGILAPDRTIDRAELGRIVFADAAARRSLDAIVHPLVLAEQERMNKPHLLWLIFTVVSQVMLVFVLPHSDLAPLTCYSERLMPLLTASQWSLSVRKSV